MQENEQNVTRVTRVLELEGQAILHCADQLKKDSSLAQAVEQSLVLLRGALESGGKIIVTGVGKSGKIAEKIASTFSSTGSQAFFLHPTEAIHGDLGMIQAGDTILVLSYTGNTEEVLRLLPTFRRKGVNLIGLGGNSNSRLAKICDVFLSAKVTHEACPHNLAPTSSTTLALALGDALAMALMQMRGFSCEEFARNHPGGSLGKKLSLRVGDLMHREKDIAYVAPHDSVREVIIKSTEKRLGIVLVVEGKKLLGVITDGDIRRYLQLEEEKFFDLKAGDMMTQNPVTCLPDGLAQSALELMENRENQISALPVLNEHREWLGVLRLHDLVQTM